MLYYIEFAYLLIIAFIFSNAKIRRKQREKLFLILSFIMLASVSACRFEWGARSDFYRNYNHAYAMLSVPWSQVFVFSEELLHPILRKIIVEVFRDPQAYFFISSFFIVGCYLVITKRYSPDIYMGVILFFCIGGYFSSHNITRQYVAIMITLLAWKYVIERKPWKYFLTILLAMGFHTAAVIVLPLYYLAGRRFNKNVLFGYTVFAALIVVLNRPVLWLIQLVMYSGYGGGYGAESSNPLRLALVFITVFCIWLLNRRNVPNPVHACGEDTVKNLRLKNLICHGAVVYSIFALLSAVNMLMFSRVASFFTACSMLAMQYGIESLGYRYNKRLMKLGLLAFAAAWFILMNANGKLIPAVYTPFWEVTWRAV
ncbi:MAG: EpsG family protein [Clostridia bacterium]|nr:EpsG family protein [Clostridia bacterium]